MFKFGVDSLIWVEEFTEKDLHLIDKAKKLGFKVIDINISHPERFPVKEVKQRIKDVGIEAVTSTGLPADANPISPKAAVRRHAIETLKMLVDINNEIGSNVIGGVLYSSWGYLSGKCRTDEEWAWSIEGMREAGKYAKSKNKNIIFAIEPVNRFETHFINIAEDAVKYCKEVGTGNVKVHLDSFHMIREETSYKEAVYTCGKEYLGYVHVCENNRGIPGTGQVPWKEFFTALKKIGYTGPLVIESFDPNFEELNRLCAIWRKFADSGEELAIKGLANLKKIEASLAKKK
ncbi:MAG TPA: sugar phosphate isomerase/epimerase family protein [Dehalococcoidales bacterium]|nr:sugar phosphate isomerase/epimerase family protein [Dehalococcoidales bacterium]